MVLKMDASGYMFSVWGKKMCLLCLIKTKRLILVLPVKLASDFMCTVSLDQDFYLQVPTHLTLVVNYKIEV